MAPPWRGPHRFNPSHSCSVLRHMGVTFSIGRKCLYLYAWTQLPGWWLYCRSNYLKWHWLFSTLAGQDQAEQMFKSTIRSSLRNLDWLRINNCRPYWHLRMVLGASILNQCARLCWITVLGKLHLASAASFDLGVYITVVGATMLLISVLGDSRHSVCLVLLPQWRKSSWSV